MEKIIVIGCPGAGKSTFSRRLREELGLPLFYLDMIWHKPDGTHISREEFDFAIRELLLGEKWIIDGNYGRTLELRLRECDTVFLLDLPLDVCLAGAEGRIGKKREDMPWVEEKFDGEFREWIEGFGENELPRIRELIEKYREGREIVIFKSREEIDAYKIPKG